MLSWEKLSYTRFLLTFSYIVFLIKHFSKNIIRINFTSFKKKKHFYTKIYLKNFFRINFKFSTVLIDKKTF